MEPDKYPVGTRSNMYDVPRRAGASHGKAGGMKASSGPQEDVKGLWVDLQRQYMAESRKLQRLTCRLERIQAAKRDKLADRLYSEARAKEARDAEQKAKAVREQGVALGRDLAAQMSAEEECRMMAFNEFLRELQLLADAGNQQTADSLQRKEEDRVRKEAAAAEANEAEHQRAVLVKWQREKDDAEKRWLAACRKQQGKEDKVRKEKEKEKREASARKMEERGKSAYVLHVEMLRKEENVATFMGYMEHQRKMKEMRPMQ